MEAETLARLGASPIFGGLTEEELGAVSALMRERGFAAGDEIVHAGDLGHELFWIERGELDVISAGGVPVATLGPGDVCGEMAIIEIAPRSASMRARSPGVLYVLHARELRQLSKTRPHTFTLILLNLARELSRRLRRADEDISSLRAALATRE